MSAAVAVRRIEDGRAWNALVERLPRADIRQGWQWGEARTIDGWRPLRLAAFRDEACTGALSLLVRRLGPLPWSVVDASGAPLLADPEDAASLDALIEETRRIAQAQRALVVRFAPRAADADLRLRGLLVSRGLDHLPDDWTTWNAPRIVMTMSLAGSEEEVKGRLRRRTREYLSASPRRGVTVRRANSIEELHEFHERLSRTGTRKGLPVRQRAYFERLWREYRDASLGALFLAEHEGRGIGWLMGARLGSTAHLLYAALREGEALHQGPLLYWEFARWARASGCSSIDWGGIGTSYPPRESDSGWGLYQFKRGFGSELVYLTGFYDLAPWPRGYAVFRWVERRVLDSAWSLRSRFNNLASGSRAAMGAVTRKVRQLRVSAAQVGLRSTLFWAAFGVLQPNRFFMFARVLEPEASPLLPPAADTRLEMWDAERVRRWRADRPQLPTEFFRDGIDGVQSCAVVLVDEQVAGLIWVYRPEDASRLFVLQDGQAELNHGVVLREHRGRGLFAVLLDYACRALGEAGYQAAFAMVHSDNQPSRSAFRRAGFKEAGSVRHFLLYRPKVRATELLRGAPEDA